MNRERPHLMILPEDRKDNDLANGFRQHLGIEAHQIQILPFPGGWTHVRDTFAAEHVKAMRLYPQRYMVLLVDFDEQENRYAQMREAVPEDLRDRTFILGCSDAPEDLCRDLKKSAEDIGEWLADECVLGQRDIWNHRMLVHNAEELERLCDRVRTFVIA